jgi:hypothetical protein
MVREGTSNPYAAGSSPVLRSNTYAIKCMGIFFILSPFHTMAKQKPEVEDAGSITVRVEIRTPID